MQIWIALLSVVDYFLGCVIGGDLRLYQNCNIPCVPDTSYGQDNMVGGVTKKVCWPSSIQKEAIASTARMQLYNSL